MKFRLACLQLVLFVAATFPSGATDPATDRAFRAHRFAKHYMYGTLAEQSAVKIKKGEEQPLLKFAVLGNPQSFFVNFEIKPDQLDNLRNHLKLPPGFQLAPIAILEDEPARYYITLNIYAVDALQGLLSGLRAEWSIYVSKNGGRVSYMIVDAKHNKLSLDPVNWFGRGTELRHARTAAGMSNFVASDNGTAFQSQITDAGIRNATRKFPEVAWVSANDRIYWRNGVADRTYYDGDFVDTPVLVIDPAAFTYTDTTVWRRFVNPVPASVLLYEKGFEIVITPWYNIDPP